MSLLLNNTQNKYALFLPSIILRKKVTKSLYLLSIYSGLFASHKTKRERVIYFSDSAIKKIKKYFTYEENELNNYCITSWGNPQKTFH